MARHWFGQSLTDWTMVLGDETQVDDVRFRPAITTGPVAVTFWDSATGGTQYTDLLDASGAPITQVTTADGTGVLPLGTIPRFQGPDGVTSMWADAGGGARYLMVATSLATTVDDQEARLSDLENIIANVWALTQSVVLSVVYDEGSATWPPRPALAGSRPVYWHGPDGNPPPAGYMQTNDQFFGWV